MFNKQISHCQGRWGGWSSLPIPRPAPGHQQRGWWGWWGWWGWRSGCTPSWCPLHAAGLGCMHSSGAASGCRRQPVPPGSAPAASAPQLGSEGSHRRRHGTETLRRLPDLGHHRELRGARASIHIEGVLTSAGGIPTADMPTAWGQPAAPVPSSLCPQPTVRDTDTGLDACLGASGLLGSLVPLLSF